MNPHLAGQLRQFGALTKMTAITEAPPEETYSPLDHAVIGIDVWMSTGLPYGRALAKVSERYNRFTPEEIEDEYLARKLAR